VHHPVLDYDLSALNELPEGLLSQGEAQPPSSIPERHQHITAMLTQSHGAAPNGQSLLQQHAVNQVRSHAQIKRSGV